MDDSEILERIHRLVAEEHDLEEGHAGKRLGEPELERLHEVEVALDQCWDLLRQRRARREAGADPDSATIRPPGVVEGYQQ